LPTALRAPRGGSAPPPPARRLCDRLGGLQHVPQEGVPSRRQGLVNGLPESMGSSSELLKRLDFDRGLEFQDEIRRRLRAPVHFPFPSPDGSFLLLVTFRRFLFRLTEESVALALQSCLGGRASDFHVVFLSNNHFRFSVFSKDVGFAIYKLRRITTS